MHICEEGTSTSNDYATLMKVYEIWLGGDEEGGCGHLDLCICGHFRDVVVVVSEKETLVVVYSEEAVFEK